MTAATYNRSFKRQRSTYQDPANPVFALSGFQKTAVSLAVSLFIGGMPLTAVQAQESATEEEKLTIEKIVVTAQKRKEYLSEAPLAVSVVAQDKLNDLGVYAAEDLVNVVPTLQSSSNGYSIRGIGSNNSFSGYSTVAVQVDGIYDPSSAALGLGVYDLSAVEVLRGPQGTVYGRNATAGVVNFQTRNPGTTFAGNAELVVGNDGERVYRGAVDLPVTEDFAVRASFQKRTNDGWDVKGAAADNYSAADVMGARLVALWHINPKLDWRVALSYGKNQGTLDATRVANYLTYPDANLQTGEMGSAQINDVDGLATYNMGQLDVTDNHRDITHKAVSSKLAFYVNDNITLTYLTGYAELVNDGLLTDTGAFRLKNIDQTTKTQSHELNLNIEQQDFSAVLGLYHYKDKLTGLQAIDIGAIAPAPFNTIFNSFGAIFPILYEGNELVPTSQGFLSVLAASNGDTNSSAAAFAQGTYNLTDDLRLTLGMRYTKDKSDRDQLSQACAYGLYTTPVTLNACYVPLAPAPTEDKHGTESSKVTWKTTLEYAASNDVMVYGTVATGYRGGGLQSVDNEERFRQYGPETLTNYEVGMRSELLDGRMNLNATAYFMDYTDLQVTAIVQDSKGVNSPITTNAAASEVKGIDLEAILLLSRQSRVSGYLSWMDASFSNFADAQDSPNQADASYNILAGIVGLGTLPAFAVADYSGNRLVNAPKFSARASFEHDFLLNNSGKLKFSIDGYWQAKSYTDIANTERASRDAYTKLDVNLRYDPAAANYYVAAYIHNLTDTRYYETSAALWSMTGVTYNAPRAYGIKVGVTF